MSKSKRVRKEPKGTQWTPACIRLLLDAVHESRGPQSKFRDSSSRLKACRKLGARLCKITNTNFRNLYRAGAVDNRLRRVFYKNKRSGELEIRTFWQQGLAAMDPAKLVESGLYTNDEVETLNNMGSNGSSPAASFSPKRPTTSPITPTSSQQGSESQKFASAPSTPQSSHIIPAKRTEIDQEGEVQLIKANKRRKRDQGFIKQNPGETAAGRKDQYESVLTMNSKIPSHSHENTNFMTPRGTRTRTSRSFQNITKGSVLNSSQRSVSQQSETATLEVNTTLPRYSKYSPHAQEIEPFGQQKFNGKDVFPIVQLDPAPPATFPAQWPLAGQRSWVALETERQLDDFAGIIGGRPQIHGNVGGQMQRLERIIQEATRLLRSHLNLDFQQPAVFNPGWQYPEELLELLAIVVGAEQGEDIRAKTCNLISSTAPLAASLDSVLHSLMSAAATKWCLQPLPQKHPTNEFFENLDGGSVVRGIETIFGHKPVAEQLKQEIIRNHLERVFRPTIPNKAETMAETFEQYLRFFIPHCTFNKSSATETWNPHHPFPNESGQSSMEPPQPTSWQKARATFLKQATRLFSEALELRTKLEMTRNGEFQVRFPNPNDIVQISDEGDDTISTHRVLIGLQPSIYSRNLLVGTAMGAKPGDWGRNFGGVVIIDKDPVDQKVITSEQIVDDSDGDSSTTH